MQPLIWRKMGWLKMEIRNLKLGRKTLLATIILKGVKNLNGLTNIKRLRFFPFTSFMVRMRG